MDIKFLYISLGSLLGLMLLSVFGLTTGIPLTLEKGNSLALILGGNLFIILLAGVISSILCYFKLNRISLIVFSFLIILYNLLFITVWRLG